MSKNATTKPNKRLKPCYRCKTQRRKCDRPSESVACFRCIKSNRECVNDDGTLEMEDDSIDGNSDLQHFALQVTSLQQDLHRMESLLQQEREAAVMRTSTSSIMKASNDRTNMDYHPYTTPITALEVSSTYSVYINQDPQSTTGLQLLPLTPSLSSNSSVINTSSTTRGSSIIDNDDDEYRWELTVVDGKLRLESPIRTFDELISYGHALQRYLSPFAGIFDNTAFLFESIQPASLIPMMVQVVARTPHSVQGSAMQQQQRNGLSMTKRHHFMLKQQLPEILLVTAGKDPPISVIDELISIYFTCINPSLPLIHGPSYLAEYETMVRPDPFQHALTMAMLSCLCSSTCNHIKYNNFERRALADYFYQRAIDRLCDTFDEPERRLETLMIINLISQYQLITMRVAEGRKWCSIAHMIAMDLQQEYNLHHQYSKKSSSPSSPLFSSSASSPSSSSTPLSPSTPKPSASSPSSSTSSSSSHTTAQFTSLEDLVPTTTDVDRALLQRHYIMALHNQKFLDFVVDHDPKIMEFLNSKPLEYVVDEDDMSYTFIAIYNKTLKLMCHPVTLDLTEQIHRMHLGEVAKVSLEQILRLDQIYKEWWHSLPSCFRLCDQYPVDTSSRPFVEKCNDQVQLIVFIITVIHKTEINLALTKPSNQSTISQGGSYELARAIQERALIEAYECIESLIVAIKQFEMIKKNLCVFSSDLLITASDLLCKLATSSSISVKDRAKDRLVEALHLLRQAPYMVGNLVPPSFSPLLFLEKNPPGSSTLGLPTSVNDLSANIIDMYSEYPTPLFAFGYDVIRKASEGH